MQSVLALGRNAGAGEIEGLVELATHAEDPLVAGTAIAALGRLGAFRATPALVPLLDDPRPRIRQEALVAAGASGDRRFVALLVARLGSVGVTPLVIQALGRLGGAAAREALVGLDPSALDAVAMAFRTQALARCGD